MLRKRLSSLAISACLLTGGVGMVAMDATPAFAASSKAKSKKKIKQGNKQKNKNSTNQESGDVRGGNVQCVGLILIVGPGGCSSTTLGFTGNLNLTVQANVAENEAEQEDTLSGNAIAADAG